MMLLAASDTAHALDSRALFALALMLFVAKIGDEIFERLRQPAVLGELLGGIALGALALLGGIGGGIDFIRADQVVAAFAEIGVIILLFEIGLGASVRELFEVGWSSLLVALVGVTATFFLGWGAAALCLPNDLRIEHIFIGAMLCATSVGITARVLKDLGRLNTREAKIILGAAVIDDVLGLLILAVMTEAIRSKANNTPLDAFNFVIIGAKALGFLAGALLVGHFIVPRLFARAARLQTRGVLIAFAVAFCFLFAWLASAVGLATIVGAFAAGLVLEESQFAPFHKRGVPELGKLLIPVGAIFTPIFFVLMGLKVDLRVFARFDLLGLALALTAAAIIGKQFCSFAVLEKHVRRLIIGIGMIPRGEVQLIFAGIGASLALPQPNGSEAPVVNSSTFGAVIIMVMITTFMTPILLKWVLNEERRAASLSSHEADEFAPLERRPEN
jgi:Kef-type K+ transport system membrane component KefB